MSLSEKRPPILNNSSNMGDVQKAISRVYDDINQIINAVNQSGLESRDTSSGKIGDIRVIKKSNVVDASTGQVINEAAYKLEAFTEDGWAETTLTIIQE